jgi:hypothetical protein
VDLQQHDVAFLRKGPIRTAEESPWLDTLQARHLAHLDAIFNADAFACFDELCALVERDPAIQQGRLMAECFTWGHGPFPAR